MYRTLTVSYVNELVKSFAMLSKHPATCAYLMPFHKETNIPMHKEEVQVEKLWEYTYWILAGQHSIYAAKLFIRDGKGEAFEQRKCFYTRRKARIVVNAPEDASCKISSMANMEAQTILKNQPYIDILQHLRAQWIAFGRPKKPIQGLVKGHKDRQNWDVSYKL